MTHHVVIVGGGASGVLMAAHLFRVHRNRENVRVTIVDAGPRIGRGLAYSTTNLSHLLNVRAAQLSAFPDDAAHFTRWVASRHPALANDEFLPRALYGEYLESVMEETAEPSKLRVLQQNCTGLRQLEGGVEVSLADGSALPAHFAIVATGFGVRPAPTRAVRDPWDGNLPEDRDASVLLVGTGLTMVDTLLSLIDAGHRGPIVAMSRRGLLPQPHAPRRPLQLSTADIPLGASLHYFSHWLTGLIRSHERLGGNWRDVMDGLRPHVQTIWKNLPPDSRRRFLRHASAHWDVHRHRMPPPQAARLAAVFDAGRLAVRKGRFLGAEEIDGKTIATYQDPASGLQVKQEFGAVFDCRGIRRKAGDSMPPFLKALVETGAARMERLGLGLDFDQNCALVDGNGSPSPRIFGLGPVTLGAFWESIAIPDIREQAQHIAHHLFGREVLAAQGVYARLP